MPQDLAQHHQPISQLFDTDESSQPFKLTAQQIESFQEQGYLAGVKLLNTKQLEVLRADLQELTTPQHDGRQYWYEYHSNESTDPSRTLFHALGAWRLRTSFHDLLWHPTFVAAAEQLLDGPVRFWHDQLFCKPARDGGVVAWHQDYSYWTRTEPMAHLTCWIGLDDSTKDNGCVHYIPGSHRWPLLPITGLAGDMDAIKAALTPDQWEQFQQPKAVELKAGECVFHHPLMVHGSFENRSDSPRRATVINVVRDGVRAKESLPLLAGANAVEAGEPLSGQCFPMLTR